MNFPTAIVLTWNSSRVRVRCPYSCHAGIHSHGFSSTNPGELNTRLPHCMPEQDDDGNHVLLSDYRLLFPFEEDPETEGMWWELDHYWKRWRTVSWRLYDPEYLEDRDDTEGQTDHDVRNEFESQTAIGEVADITHALSNLTVHDPEAQIDDNIRDKSKRQMVVEEAHRDSTDLPLENGADQECRDWNGDTSLLRALDLGCGILAEKLIDAGADLDVSNNDRKSMRDKARISLEAQKDIVRFERLMIHPRETPFIHFDWNSDTVRKNMKTREKEICALRRIIASYDRKQTIKQFLIQLRQVGNMYGEEQAESFQQHGELDDQALLIRLLDRVMRTPRETRWKTVAGLSRGNALPWIFAVSGYSSSSSNGALHRPTWINRVFDLAKLVGHDLRANGYDEKGRAGSFFACHSEKQLLAYFVWSHTTNLCSRSISSLDSLRQSEANQISKLHAEIYICKPGQSKADMCGDCYDFCQRTVLHLGFRLTVNGVINSRVTWTKEFSPRSTSRTAKGRAPF